MFDLLLPIVWRSAQHTLEISALIFLMMVIVDLVNVRTRGLLVQLIRRGPFRQYVISSGLGVIPGCFGAFMAVTLYVHGLIGFGALTGTMIASSGDAAFVLLATSPKTALYLFPLLFITGMAAGFLVERAVRSIRWIPCKECPLQQYHEEDVSWRHYVRVHIWQHIIKEHLLRIVIWMFFILVFIELALHFWNLERFVQEYRVAILVVAALVGLIPDSGPHILFIGLYAQGVIPFSVLLTNAISQDGHGSLPLFSISTRDAVLVKLVNFVIAICVGGLVFMLGF
jgi:hypothetical protein